MANSAICFKEVSKLYGKGESATYALRDASFSVEGGSFVVVLGPSGAGKTTLLNLLGGMDSATSGAIMVDDTDICRLSERELTAFRAQQIGYIFQFYNLIPTLTAAENIELMRSVKSDSLAASQVLEEVGLAGHERKFPSQLSGGEQQRVSIARAIAKRPRLLLCDEPTGALDSATGVRVLKLLRQQADSGQTTVLVVTHNAQIAQIADVAIKVRDGRVESLKANPQPLPVEEVQW